MRRYSLTLEQPNLQPFKTQFYLKLGISYVGASNFYILFIYSYLLIFITWNTGIKKIFKMACLGKSVGYITYYYFRMHTKKTKFYSWQNWVHIRYWQGVVILPSNNIYRLSLWYMTISQWVKAEKLYTDLMKNLHTLSIHKRYLLQLLKSFWLNTYENWAIWQQNKAELSW